MSPDRKRVRGPCRSAGGTEPGPSSSWPGTKDAGSGSCRAPSRDTRWKPDLGPPRWERQLSPSLSDDLRAAPRCGVAQRAARLARGLRAGHTGWQRRCRAGLRGRQPRWPLSPTWTLAADLKQLLHITELECVCVQYHLAGKTWFPQTKDLKKWFLLVS